MLTLGVDETLELLDGAPASLTIRFVASQPETVALAAPALAAAVEAVAGWSRNDELSVGQRDRLLARLSYVLRKTEPPRRGEYAASTVAQPYKLLPLSPTAIEILGRLHTTTMHDPIDPADAAVFAVALAEEATLILLDTEASRAVVSRAREAGHPLRVDWI